MPRPKHGRKLYNGPNWGVVRTRPARRVRQGITRATNRPAPVLLPLTEQHLAVLQQLGPTPRGSTAIAVALGVKLGTATSHLYLLQRRGLAERRSRGGWVRVSSV